MLPSGFAELFFCISPSPIVGAGNVDHTQPQDLGGCTLRVNGLYNAKESSGAQAYTSSCSQPNGYGIPRPNGELLAIFSSGTEACAMSTKKVKNEFWGEGIMLCQEGSYMCVLIFKRAYTSAGLLCLMPFALHAYPEIHSPS